MLAIRHKSLWVAIALFHRCLTSTEVYIKKIGNAIALIAKYNPWRSLIDSLDNFSDDFMTNCDRPLIDTRDSL
jgi:antitoxin VapB